MQLLLGLVEVGGKVRAREVAEVTCDSLALSESLNVWVLLSARLQVGRHQVLSALRILEEGEIEEGLLLIQISSALGVL
jgi:hypothetical protein